MKSGRARFLAGAGALSLGASVSMIVQLTLAWQVVKVAGIATLGEWAMITAIIAMLSVFDLGLQQAVSRYSAFFVQRQTLGSVRSLVGISATVCGGYVAVLVACSALFAGRLAAAVESLSAPKVWMWIPVLLLGQMLAGQVRAACIGIGRASSVGKSDVVGSVVQLAATLLVLAWAPGVEALALGLMARSMALLVLNGALLLRARGNGERKATGEHSAIAVLKFAIPVALTGLLGAGFFNLPKLILGASAGAAAVGEFEYMNRFASVVLFVVAPVYATALPELTQAKADEGRVLLLSARIRGGVTIVTGLASATLIIVAAATFTKVGIGSGLFLVGAGLQCLAYGLLAITGVATTYLRAARRQWLEFCSLGPSLVVLVGLLLAGQASTSTAAAGAMALASAFYFVALRFAMHRRFLGAQTAQRPQLKDLAFVVSASGLAMGATALALSQLGGGGVAAWTGLLGAGALSWGAIVAMARTTNPYQSSAREVWELASGWIQERRGRRS